MHPLLKNPSLLTVLIAFVALLIWPGCATVPVPATRTTVKERKSGDFGFIRKGKTSRSDVVAKLGAPDGDYSDIKVVHYTISMIEPRGVFMITVVPTGTVSRGGIKEQIAFIEFDEQDRVKRSTILTTTKNAREAAVNWLAGKAP